MSARTVRLGEVAAVFNGKTPSKAEQRSSGHPVLKIKDVDETGRFIGRFDSFVERGLAAKFAEKAIQNGDTLILNAAHNAEYVGSKSFFACGSAVGALATGEWLLLRPEGKCADSRFIFYWSQHSETRRKLADLVKGIHLYPADVAGLPIPLPDLAEQKRITGLLEQADRLRQTRRYALGLSDTFLPAAFLEFFGDPAKNPKGFPMQRIETVFDKRREGAKCGPFGSALKKNEYVPQGIPVLTMDNVGQNEFYERGCLYITPSKFEELKAYDARNGDILVSRAGTVGRMAIVNTKHERSIIHSNIIRLSLDSSRCLPVYFTVLMTFFAAQVGRLKRGQEDAYTFMNTGRLAELKIPLPPLAMQSRFAVLVDRHEQLRASQREALRQAEHFFQSLLHRAFAPETQAHYASPKC